MSILIKGMDMPKDKAVAVIIHPDGTAYTAKCLLAFVQNTLQIAPPSLSRRMVG